MGFWSRIKSGISSAYKSVDRAVGGYLPGGVAPSSSSSSSSTSTSSTSSSGKTTSSQTSGGGGGSSSGSTSYSSGGATVTTTEIKPQTFGVIVTDYTTGESVTTKTTGGRITSQTYSGGGGSSGGSSSIFNTGTYDVTTQTYTDPQGNKMSMRASDIPQGTAVTFGSSLSSGGRITPQSSSSSSGGGLISVGYERPQKQEFGVILTKPGENVGNAPHWEVQSTNFNDLQTEMAFASWIPQRTDFYKTRGSYEYNVQQIAARKDLYNQYTKTIAEFNANPQSFKGRGGVQVSSTKEGELIELTPKFFETNLDVRGAYTRGLTTAKQSYAGLPTSEKIKLNVTGGLTGLTKVGVGALEFGGTMITNLGVQTYKEGEQIKPFSFGKKFYFGGTLGSIATYPTTQTSVGFFENPKQYLKEKVTSPEFVGSASGIGLMVYAGGSQFYRTSQAYGVKTATGELIGSLSPLRIAPGVYYSTSDKFKVTSFKGTNQQGITTRIYGGRAIRGDTSIIGAEKSAVIGENVIGGGYITSKTPYIEISRTGRIIEGIRSTIQPYSFEQTGAGASYIARGNTFYSQKLSSEIPGGTARVISSRGAEFYSTKESLQAYNYIRSGIKTYSSGTATKDIAPGVTKFVSGKAKPIYEFEINRAEKVFIYRPSGRYRTEPTIKGVEYDINKLFSNAADVVGRGGVSGSGGRAATKTITKTSGSPQISLDIPKTEMTTTGGAVRLIQPSKSSGVQRAVSYSPSSQLIEIQRSQQKERDAVIPAVSFAGAQALRSASASLGLMSVKPAVDVVSKNRFSFAQVVDTAQITKQAQRQGLGLITTSPGFARGDFFTPPRSTPIYFEPPFFALSPGGLGLSSNVLKGGERKTGYTPSFSALVFNIRGSYKPSGLAKSGIDFRPITPGFSFITGGRSKVNFRKLLRI